jgi:hypothetical protein
VEAREQPPKRCGDTEVQYRFLNKSKPAGGKKAERAHVEACCRRSSNAVRESVRRHQNQLRSSDTIHVETTFPIGA